MNSFTVRNSAGAVDVVASVSAYTQALQTWVSENEADVQQLTDTVNEVFDKYPSQVLPMPALVSMVVTELGATPSEHKTVTARVYAHVRCMAAEGGTLQITRGKGGGVTRLA